MSTQNGRVFSVTVFGDIDADVLKSSVEDTLPEGTVVFVGDKGIKGYSEQGMKVARARKTGVTVELAGDSVAKPKKTKNGPVALRVGPVGDLGDEPAVETATETSPS